MSSRYEGPSEWKSEVWWRNRPVEERQVRMALPPRIMADWNDDIKVPVPGNVFIYGPSGSGKSNVAAHVLHEAVTLLESSGRWIEADDYIEMLKDSFDNNGLLPEMYAVPHLIKHLKGTFDYVVLDGLGEERQTEFASHEVASLIRKRYERMKSTVITSRLSISDVKSRYGDRLASVLADFDVVRL